MPGANGQCNPLVKNNAHDTLSSIINACQTLKSSNRRLRANTEAQADVAATTNAQSAATVLANLAHALTEDGIEISGNHDILDVIQNAAIAVQNQHQQELTAASNTNPPLQLVN